MLSVCTQARTHTDTRTRENTTHKTSSCPLQKTLELCLFQPHWTTPEYRRHLPAIGSCWTCSSTATTVSTTMTATGTPSSTNSRTTPQWVSPFFLLHVTHKNSLLHWLYVDCRPWPAQGQPLDSSRSTTRWLKVSHLIAQGQPLDSSRSTTRWLKVSHSIAQGQPLDSSSSTTRKVPVSFFLCMSCSFGLLITMTARHCLCWSPQGIQPHDQPF